MTLFTDEMRRNPYPVYAALRQGGASVVPMEHLGLTMVLDHEGVKRTLSDTEAFSSDLTPVRGETFEMGGAREAPRRKKLQPRGATPRRQKLRSRGIARRAETH